MNIENIQIVGDALIETNTDGNKDIILTIDSDACVFVGDTVCLTIILNGIVMGYWR